MKKSNSEKILICRDNCPWWLNNTRSFFSELPEWCGFCWTHLGADNPAFICWHRGSQPSPHGLVRWPRSGRGKEANLNEI